MMTSSFWEKILFPISVINDVFPLQTSHVGYAQFILSTVKYIGEFVFQALLI